VDGNDIDGLLWEVRAGTRLTIYVVDEVQRPVPGALIRLQWPRAGSLNPATMSVTADSQGQALLTDGLYPGMYIMTPEGGYEGQPVAVDIAEGMERVESTLHLVGRGSIQVTVQDTRSVPVDEVQVSAKAIADSPRLPQAMADSQGVAMRQSAGAVVGRWTYVATPLGNGRFRVGPLPRGRYEVGVRDEVGADSPPSRTVEVPGGQVEVSFVLDRSGRITGSVVDDRNQPVPDAWVRISCSTRARTVPEVTGLTEGLRSALTAADGRYSAVGMSAQSSCDLRVEDNDGIASAPVTAHAGDDVVLRILSAGSLSGSARSEAGRTIDQFNLSMLNPRAAVSRSQIVSTVDGTWTLPKVSPGTWILHASAGNQTATEHVELGPGQSIGNLLLTFRSAGDAPIPP